MSERAPQFVTVPKGTRPAQCRGPSCKAVIYFVPWPSTGKAHPIDCDVDGGFEPTDHEDGQGVSHYATCSDAAQFRRAKR